MAGQCSLVHAAKHGRLSVVSCLLACDWNTSTDSEAPKNYVEVKKEEATQQALVAAAAQGHESVVEYFLDMSEVFIDKLDTLIGETALSVAATNGSTTTVASLLTRGANPSIFNIKGFSPLMLAAREGHWGTADRILQSNISYNNFNFLL